MSTESLFSEHWYRVKDIKPLLAPDVQVARHNYRLQTVYILRRASTRRWHRLGATAWELVARFDGQRSVQQIWQESLANQGNDAASQAELIGLLGQLHEADLLVVDTRLDAEEILGRRNRLRGRETRQRFLSPLSLRVPLFDPDSLVSRLNSWIPGRVGSFLALGTGMLYLLALFLLLPRLPDLQLQLQQTQFNDPWNVLLMLVSWPVLKLLHELAHALVLKRYGGEVRECGIALLVLFPNPYVDASAANMLASKYQRILVSAAGILTELSLAAIAVLVWINASGLIQQAALNVILIGTFSTLVFNGNPLLKFDGYYMLADWLEIPDLSSRSQRWWRNRLARLLRIPDTDVMVTSDAAERRWLIGYGLFSTLYRVVLMLSIAWMISGQYFFFGLALAIYVMVVTFLLPVCRAWSFMQQQPGEIRRRVLAIVTLLTLLGTGVVAAVPMPKVTVTDGIVWLPEQAVLRIDQDCEIVQLYVTPGERVKKGDKLFDCREDERRTEVVSLESELQSLDAQRAGLLLNDPVTHQSLGFERTALLTRLELARERLRHLQARAAVDGQFLVSDTRDLQGRFIPANTTVAYVIPPDLRTVRLVLAEKEMQWLSQGNAGISLFIDQAQGEEVFASQITRQRPRATYQVPSPALTTLGGGSLVAEQIDSGVRLREPVFDIELAWPPQAGSQAIGSRVRVRLDHGSATLVERLVPALRAWLLEQRA